MNVSPPSTSTWPAPRGGEAALGSGPAGSLHVSPPSTSTWSAPRGGEAVLGSGPAGSLRASTPEPGLRGFFITGTDTEIGKTCITAGLTHLFADAGLRVAPVKSLAAGQEQDASGAWVNDDVQRLHAAQRIGMSVEQVGPWQFRAACAPHIAAALEGRAIESEAVLAAIRASARLGELALVEGVGGFRVPLAPGWDTADLAVDLQLPVILVVGLRLGCINHALLTAEAMAARGLRLAGWVANTVDAQMPHVADNLAALKAGLSMPFKAPCLGHVPRLSEPTSAAVAAHLVQPKLLELIR
ncbi:dethiobiotin synthase [Paucibacter sp. APW11]|uniref:ATP-dependent dethiobiotin synthetase BioD n=1 Tax=Roseateles aquae TaxID=3077235 RepID=A0ABU3PEY9_9BURK|nr:dethiobiotin synthase [Paucibacter sp. APW11]MDT9000727.1 dethiobiotin synthase [Paucibacter sp. APW11]